MLFYAEMIDLYYHTTERCNTMSILSRFLSWGLVTALLTTQVTTPVSYGSTQPTPFLTQRTQGTETLNNQTSYLSTHEAMYALNHIKEYWSLEYPNHNFLVNHAQFHNEALTSPTPLIPATEESEAVYADNAKWTYRVDVTIHTDQAVTKSLDEHPIYLGIMDAYGQMNGSDLALVSSTVEQYARTLEESYMNYQPVIATYRLIYSCSFDPSMILAPMPEPTYYFQQKYTNDKALMPSLTSYDTGVTRYQGQVHEGYTALWSLVTQLRGLKAPSRYDTYRPAVAVNYALTHGTDVPQYNADNRMGSDCANFVSYCLQAGGITTDQAGLWYPSSSSYGGGNWIRTGFTPSVGGVTIYMKERNLFFQQSNPILSPAGSILFYQDDSHVGLLTYHDGEVAVYAHRSNYIKEYNNYLHEGNFVDYYSPNPVIVSYS